MIRFTKTEDNKQYISIIVKDDKDPLKVYNYITSAYDTLKNLPCIMDNEEIAIKLCGNSSLGFSLNELRRQLKQIADVVVSIICVDLSVYGQRVH